MIQERRTGEIMTKSNNVVDVNVDELVVKIERKPKKIRTTLMLSPVTLDRAKRLAEKENLTVSKIVEALLRAYLDKKEI